MKFTKFFTICAATFVLVESNQSNTVKLISGSCTVHDPQIVVNTTCWMKAINRTTTVFNARAYLPQPVDDVFMNFKLSKKADLKYLPFLINMTEDFCSFMAKQKQNKYLRYFALVSLQYTNLNHSCPFSGEFIVKDFNLDPKLIPILWPSGEYRWDTLILSGKKKLLTMTGFGIVGEINH